ncbi:YveK family protein [Propionibacterium australiense]|uniref:Chain length determinant protein n=1 Tax=Propionibacterium australiense TaxID=119981 RepID=A0A383S4S8_9ACTN|nr:Wzz/FepE/Etk N-terminal domain-containing protein [Propionibacterium australiense]RLP10658.1 hypothetical protein D9T14_05275 [Propionibacterium australiense]RLP12953.1 hypothetical protein D7U36_00520 [Propionibacterium australiense]SYZ32863.1 Chain length determinant protein [Propionibacterium australiense]VEH91093.1 Capsular polysaccharide biosynthesis protein [Propionibacterium australiense]
MKTPRILHAVRAHWVIVLVVAVIGLLGGTGWAVLSTPSYSSTASLLVGVADPAEGADQTYLSSTPTMISNSMSTYSSLATSGAVLNEVSTRLGLHQPAAELAERISATVPLNATIIEVTATGEDPDRVVELANTTVEVLGEEIVNTGVKQSSGDPALKTVRIQDGADKVTENSTDPLTGGAIGLLAGLVLGTVIALVIESARGRGPDVPQARRGHPGSAHQTHHQEVVEFL